MSSQENMSFDNDANPIPYHLYGGMGGPICLDTLPPVQVQMNGPVITWPNHPIQPNQGMFFSSTDPMTGLIRNRPYFAIGHHSEIYPAANKMTADTFHISERHYAPPGGPNFPSVDAPVSGSGMLWVTPFKLTLPGSMGGGIIGDQSGPQAGVGFDYVTSMFFAGESGSCNKGCGGRGAGNPFGAGAIEQYGGMEGNTGGDPGGGGSGGGMGTPASPIMIGDVKVIPYSMAEQVGPSGGASGGWGFAKLPLRPTYYYFCGDAGQPAPAGPGGWAGGRGGYPVLMFVEG